MAVFNSTILRLAREQHGLSQSELARRLSVQQAVLSKYENGIAEPSESVLAELSNQLGYPVAFFMQDAEDVPSGLIFHRKRQSLSASLRTKIEAEVKLRVMDVLFLYGKLGHRSDIISREGRTPEETAQCLRKQWKVRRGPIPNMISLLERHGIVVIEFDFETDKLDGFFVPLRKDIICIALNTNPCFSADRRRFSLAHELGHALLHQNDFPDSEKETEADAFAAEFLMPEATIQTELEPPLTFSKLCELKTRWKASIASLVFRAKKLETISENTYRNIWMFLSAKGYRKHEPECGVQEERSALLQSLMRDYAEKNVKYLEELNLTQARFGERYCQIQPVSRQRYGGD
ncbi:MAG: XRE family transcriptional regulator [Planctomycetia bacterium]|nr:XRE family transcriptional regulator [Planctomycetia bacterium]